MGEENRDEGQEGKREEVSPGNAAPSDVTPDTTSNNNSDATPNTSGNLNGGQEKPEVKEPQDKPEEHIHHIQHEPPKKPENTENVTNKLRKNPFILSTLVFGALTILLLISMLSGGENITGNVVSKDIVGDNLVEHLKEVIDPNVELMGIVDDGNFYEVTIGYEGQEIPIYVTKDGASYTPNLLPLTAPSSDDPTIIQEAPQAGETPQTEEPDIVGVSVDDDAMKGDANAPVTIIEFSDYECPFCGRHFSDTLPQIIEEYVDTGKVNIVFRDFPLGFHDKAQKAAEAAECAGEQDMYWEMHDKLFENQGDLSVDSLKTYAADVGLDTEVFNECLDSGAMAEEVKKDMADGESYGVSGTPANFINGRFVSGAQPFSVFKQIIEEELAK